MKVTVTEKEVKITQLSQINRGDYNVNECEFRLPESFNGLSVMAVFNGICVPLVNSRCYVPSLEKGNCVLGAYAYRSLGEEFELLYSPKPTVFYVEEGSYTENPVRENLPAVDETEKYCELLRDYWEEIIESNTLPEYRADASEKSYYSAKVINGMYSALQGDMDAIGELIGGDDV